MVCARSSVYIRLSSLTPLPSSFHFHPPSLQWLFLLLVSRVSSTSFISNLLHVQTFRRSQQVFDMVSVVYHLLHSCLTFFIVRHRHPNARSHHRREGAQVSPTKSHVCSGQVFDKVCSVHLIWYWPDYVDSRASLRLHRGPFVGHVYGKPIHLSEPDIPLMFLSSLYRGHLAQPCVDRALRFQAMSAVWSWIDGTLRRPSTRRVIFLCDG